MNPFRIRESDAEGRNTGLDLVRAAAIALVLISHGRYFLPDFEGKILMANGGFFGVELFFVLSGFLIGSILIRAVTREGPTWHALTNFWMRRWFRTLPNYFLFLFLNWLIWHHIYEQRPFHFAYLFFFQNMAWPEMGLIPESWSLAVEEWFYITFPLFLFITIRLAANRKGFMLTAILLYIATFTGLRFGFLHGLEPHQWDIGIRKVVLCRLDAIGYGILVAYLKFFHAEKLSRIRHTLLLPAVLLIAFSAWENSQRLLTGGDALPHAVMLTATSAGLAMLLPWFMEMQIPKGPLRSIIVQVSIVSYSMYLSHYALVSPFVDWLRRTWPGQHYVLYYVLFWVISLYLSTLVYNFYEKPMTRIRRKFTRKEETKF